MINAIKKDDIAEINRTIDQITMQLVELTKRKQELERRKQERYLFIVK
jgi:hypothetical protein